QCPEIKLNPLIKLNFCSASTSAKAAFYSTQIPCQPGAEGFFEKITLRRSCFSDRRPSQGQSAERNREKSARSQAVIEHLDRETGELQVERDFLAG
ncbi:MAG: hypothetical protein WBI41_00235, partial [Azovibrio sp.]|uniref:hypothetical protein n=1 Tax=Azovibrio sp. TaxID=1872673 RepID=UPI003C7418DB